MKNTYVLFGAILTVMAVLLAGCQPATQATQPPTNTSNPPSAIPSPTNTPVPTPTAAPTDTPMPPTPNPTAQPKRSVGTIDELIGTWNGYWSDINTINMEFSLPGVARLSWGSGDVLIVEDFTFGNGLLTWGVHTFAASTPQNCLDHPEATYEVQITYRGDQPEKLHFKLVGEDNCYDRQEFLDGKTLKWVKSATP